MTHQVEIKLHFRAGHRLMEPYKGKCNNPHGEGYTAILFFESENLDSNGMVLDFGLVKNVVKNIIDNFYDHAFMFNKKDVVGGLPMSFHRLGYKIYLMEGNPTAENIAKDLYEKVKKAYPSLKKVGIVESFDDSIAWYEEKNQYEEVSELSKLNLKNISQDFQKRLVDMFKNINLSVEAPGFDWKKKVCYECGKDIPNFSEWCVFHFKKRRDFCSQKCFDNFAEEYKNLKEGKKDGKMQ